MSFVCCKFSDVDFLIFHHQRLYAECGFAYDKCISVCRRSLGARQSRCRGVMTDPHLSSCIQRSCDSFLSLVHNINHHLHRQTIYVIKQQCRHKVLEILLFLWSCQQLPLLAVVMVHICWFSVCRKHGVL